MSSITVTELKALTAQVEKITEMGGTGITSITITVGNLNATLTKLHDDWNVSLQERNTGSYFDR